MKKGIFIMSEKKYWDNKIETLPQSEIKKLQEKRLKEILNFAYTNSAYYKKSFNTADVKPSDFKILSDINRFPFITKQIERERQLKKPILGDIDAVVRGIPEVTGEYVIHVLKENFATKYKVEIEKVANSDKTDEQVRTKVSDALKIRLGVRPKEIIVLRDGTIPRTTHKAKRFIDERK
jgi:phenylacetate-coenzyme A ligase PaaK-like adenylate-forming protein